LLQCYGFIQHVAQPTHKEGHTRPRHHQGWDDHPWPTRRRLDL